MVAFRYGISHLTRSLHYLRAPPRIREMVSFKLGKEMEKDVFHLVTNVGQRENLSLFLYRAQTLPSLLIYLQT